MQHRCILREVCSLYTMGQIPLWTKISPARDLLLLFQSAKEDKTPLEINAPPEWKEEWGGKKGCPISCLLLHSYTQGFSVILTYITLKGEETRRTSHTERDGQLPIAAALGAPVSNQEQESSLAKEPSTEGNVKTITLHSSSSNKYFLTSHLAALETV